MWTFSKRMFVVASLAMCVAAAVLWARSHFVRDLFGRGRHQGVSVEISSVRGRLEVRARTGFPGDSAPAARWFHASQPIVNPQSGPAAPSAGRAWHQRLGFAWETNPKPGWNWPPGRRALYASVPHWAAVLVTAAPPTLWLLAWRRRKHLANHAASRRCAACGYDLRATPDRCPECGAEPAPATRAAAVP